MVNIAILVAAGPCLIATMAAIALFIVHRSLSPVRHALIWSAAFAATALRWGVYALRNFGDGAVLRGGLVHSLLGMLPLLLLAEGFRVRAGAVRQRWIIPCVGGIAMLLQIAAFLAPAIPLRAALSPIVSGGLLIWSATMVVPRDRRSSVAEVTVVLLLALFAAIELGGVALAIAEQIGALHSRSLYIALYSATVTPICAAIGMTTLLLIAFDFSAEQRRLIHTDPLTGILNRLGFEHAAKLAMARRRRSRPLSLALADIDGFKGVNDRYGHAAGDETLIGFARHLAGGLERDEAVGRIGGEEFAMLLPGSDGPAAFGRIEPIRGAVADLEIDTLPEIAITASFGIAEHAPGEPLARLIARADEALYASKRNGRNRSTLAVPGPA